MMADVFTFWDFANEKSVTNSVCSHQSPTEESISVISGISTSNPFPAMAGLANMAHESLFFRCSISALAALGRVKSKAFPAFTESIPTAFYPNVSFFVVAFSTLFAMAVSKTSALATAMTVVFHIVITMLPKRRSK